MAADQDNHPNPTKILKHFSHYGTEPPMHLTGCLAYWPQISQLIRGNYYIHSGYKYIYMESLHPAMNLNGPKCSAQDTITKPGLDPQQKYTKN